MPIPIGFERDQIRNVKYLEDRLTKLEKQNLHLTSRCCELEDRSKGEIERMFTELQLTHLTSLYHQLESRFSRASAELQQKNADFELRCRRLEDHINRLDRALVELQNEKIWLELRFAWMLFPRRPDSEKRPDFTTRTRTPSPDRMSQAGDNEHGSLLQEEDEGPINSVDKQEAADSMHSSTSETYCSSSIDEQCAYNDFIAPQTSPFCRDEFALRGCLERVRKMSIQDSLRFLVASSDAFVKEESSEETVVMIHIQAIMQARVQRKKKWKKNGDGAVLVQWRSRKSSLARTWGKDSELIVRRPDGYFYLGTFCGQGNTVLNCDEFQALDLPVREAVIRATAGKVAMNIELFREISCAYSLGKLLACRVELKKTGFNDTLAGALRTVN